MCHGYVDEWWDEYRNCDDKKERARMLEWREKALKEFNKKYEGMKPHQIRLDQMVKGEGIYGAVSEIIKAFRDRGPRKSDILLQLLQEEDNKRYERRFSKKEE